MAEIGAEADVFMAPLDGLADGIGIPKCGGFGMIVEADFEVVFFAEFFEHIDGIEGLGGNTIEAEGFGKFEILACFRFVIGNADNTKVYEGDVVFFCMSLECGDGFCREIGTELEVFVLGAENLSGKNFDTMCTSLGGFFDGFKEGEIFQ